MPTPDRPLLLDTHCWLWMETGETQKFSHSTRTKINKAYEAGDLRVSAISVWELAMLDEKGRIALEPNALSWIKRSLSFPGIVLIPLTPEIAVNSTRLPGKPVGDPADRILLATASSEGVTLITRDRHLLKYAADYHWDVIAA